MSLVPLSFGADDNPPLIFIHDISGSPFSYLPFGLHSSLSQYTIYGLSALPEPPATQAVQYSTISAWGEAYAALIESELKDIRGIVLGGWSLGGILAAEVARVFARRTGKRKGAWIEVRGLILLDTYAPWLRNLLRAGRRGLEGGGVVIASAYFKPGEMMRIGELLGNTERTAWPGMDGTRCAAWLITPSAAGANGLEDWFEEGRIRRIGQGKEACNHFSMMDAGWIEEVIAGVSDALEGMRS
ncbi:Alpha/Beta hydrolase protein [Mycena rosella]|uniref:Alpha/Beta hydrolase protein n=1 Tax=Mycena rosella TaxID=1033263 RepID=A0AAD7BDS4_MYCRO|nr:Alpha/Beta hydrolase protein [Mycena rosella]